MNILLFFVGISGAFSVLFGAWLSHSEYAITAESMKVIDKALLYQFIHTLALYITVLYLKFSVKFELKVDVLSKVTLTQKPSAKLAAITALFSPIKLITTACLFFTVGIVLFSGGIYLKVIFDILTFAKLIPLGGILLSLAWCLIALSTMKLVSVKQS